MAEAPPEKLPPGFVRHLVTYALADIFGMLCFVLGVSWFVPALAPLRSSLGAGPQSLVEAAAFLAGGLAVMAWAMARLLRAVNRLKVVEPAGPRPD